jgi:hypothetical protein
MKKIYSNNGTYAATCINPDKRNSSVCCDGSCEDCRYSISNDIIIEGEFLPPSIMIEGMEYKRD